MSPPPNDIERVDEILASAGFDPDESILTRRQAEVLVLRERGVAQHEIADRLGTSRANISSIESTARDNVAKAAETVAFAEAIRSPVRVRIEPGVALIEVPERVYKAADEAGMKVAATAPELLKRINERAENAVDDGTVVAPILIGVDPDGEVRIRRSRSQA